MGEQRGLLDTGTLRFHWFPVLFAAVQGDSLSLPARGCLIFAQLHREAQRWCRLDWTPCPIQCWDLLSGAGGECDAGLSLTPSVPSCSLACHCSSSSWAVGKTFRAQTLLQNQRKTASGQSGLYFFFCFKSFWVNFPFVFLHFLLLVFPVRTEVMFMATRELLRIPQAALAKPVSIPTNLVSLFSRYVDRQKLNLLETKLQ